MRSANDTNGTVAYALAKRLLDIVVSFLSLILLTPVFLFSAILIKLSSRGPVLFVNTRIGLNGKEIRLLKFRTMTLSVPTTPITKARNLSEDPRMTAIGRFLRRYSFDEAPMLINILKGDLSLVGPRPALPFELDHYTDEHRERFSVKPGLTGLWQTYGRERGENSFDDMMRIDIEYSKKKSIILDLRILAKTLGLTLSGKTSY